MSEWWAKQCPSRSPGLSHAHWSRCDPKQVHPADSSGNEGHKHEAKMCCHCERTEAMDAMMEAAAIAMETANSPTPDDPRPQETTHEYVATIVGRCARCQRPKADHAVLLKHADDGECGVDHDSISSKRLIGDDGERWSSCPSCDTQIEPKFAKGEPGGRYGRGRDGRGRGPISGRHEAELLALVKREQFQAWLKEQGRD